MTHKREQELLEACDRYKDQAVNLRKPYEDDLSAMPANVSEELDTVLHQWESAQKELSEVKENLQVELRSKNEDRWSALQEEESKIVTTYRSPEPRRNTETTTSEDDDPSGLSNDRLMRGYFNWSRDGEMGIMRMPDGQKIYHSLNISEDESGGYLRPPAAMSNAVIQTIDDQVPMYDLSAKITVKIGQEFKAPVRKTRQESPEWTNEVDEVAQEDRKPFGMYTWSPRRLSKMIRLSRDIFMLDNAVAASEWGSEVSYSFGTTIERALLFGTGAEQPLGMFHVSGDNPIGTDRDVEVGTTSGFTYNALQDATYNLKQGHRQNAIWMFHRESIARLAKVTDTQDRPLWRAGLAPDAPDTLSGRPIYESEFIPNDFSTGNYVGAFFDPRMYRVVVAKNMDSQRLNELFALTNEIGFIFRMYLDGRPTLGEAFSRIKVGT